MVGWVFFISDLLSRHLSSWPCTCIWFIFSDTNLFNNYISFGFSFTHEINKIIRYNIRRWLRPRRKMNLARLGPNFKFLIFLLCCFPLILTINLAKIFQEYPWHRLVLHCPWNFLHQLNYCTGLNHSLCKVLTDGQNVDQFFCQSLTHITSNLDAKGVLVPNWIF